MPDALARDVANLKAREVFGDRVRFLEGPVIHASDLFGKAEVSIFVFAKSLYFPPDEELLASIRKGMAYEDEIEKGRIPPELDASVDENAVLAKMREMKVPLYEPDGTLTGLFNRFKLEAVIGAMRRLRYGVDDGDVTHSYSSAWANSGVDWNFKTKS